MESKANSTTTCPEEFLCPISLEIMEDPVVTATGITCERKRIEEWFFVKNKKTCPATSQELKNFDLTPNHLLKRIISSWRNKMSLEQEGEEKMPQPNVRVPRRYEVTHATLLGKARTTFNKRVLVPETNIGG
ncbi:hypothetical protein L6164_023623 [Bauhinia variegata]|uniref:Uncharacterized protein n=1 Tax=Bauhinia variegata TaxID=167791 RepID=A0ACB9MIS7_BAUVA|nr:hypothetical protein L6164_023623 [Bauhinia variegata]